MCKRHVAIQLFHVQKYRWADWASNDFRFIHYRILFNFLFYEIHSSKSGKIALDAVFFSQMSPNGAESLSVEGASGAKEPDLSWVYARHVVVQLFNVQKSR